MPEALIRNLSQPRVPLIRARYCSPFLCRLRGLTFHRTLLPECGLLLVQSRDSRLDSAIHMLFVWMDLAVVWINSDKEIVDIRLARRWRPIYLSKAPARYVLELNVIHLKDFAVGDHINIEKVLD